ncbi:MAG TPA: G/U mismatch-specific DNA glycosylase [Actinomycetaceae bacterium]|nr:G/U mismatch-specific DNA glycosylase [Actinomycetaceae bacterium]
MAGGRPPDLENYRGATMTDVVGPGMRLLLVGINPGLWSAAVDAPFARPGNRFWPAMFRAGLTSRPVDASRGLDPADRQDLLGRGVGITNLVGHATARAAELRHTELREGGTRLERTVGEWRPAVVAVLGLTAYRTAFGRRSATAGEQTEPLAGALLWVLPNPSGLNAHETVESLAAGYRQVAEAAGVPGMPANP